MPDPGTLAEVPCPVCGTALPLEAVTEGSTVRLLLGLDAIAHLATHGPPGDGGEPVPLPLAA